MAFTRGTESKLLTPEEVASHLGISPWTLRRWVSTKRIECVRIGRLTRFRPDQLDRYIDRQTRKEHKR